MDPRQDLRVWGWENFFSEIGRFVEDSGRQYGRANEAYAEFVLERLQLCITNVAGVQNSLQLVNRDAGGAEGVIAAEYSHLLDELLIALQFLSVQWQEYIDHLDSSSAADAYHVAAVRSGGRGRPRFDIGREQLEYLASLSFTWTDIARLLGVSRMTVYRRRRELGMLDEPPRTLDDNELRRFITELRRESPNVGEVIVLGRLRSNGMRVPRERVRQMIRETDPINTALRWRGLITPRHPYSVPGPNSLWHIGQL